MSPSLRPCFVLGCLILSLVARPIASHAAETYEILIKGGHVIDARNQIP